MRDPGLILPSGSVSKSRRYKVSAEKERELQAIYDKAGLGDLRRALLGLIRAEPLLAYQAKKRAKRRKRK